MPYESVLDVLADPTRRTVVERLARGPHNVTELAAEFSISRPAISQHLRALREAGLVHDRKVGTQRIYYVRPAAIGELRAYLDGVWSDILAQMDSPRND